MKRILNLRGFKWDRVLYIALAFILVCMILMIESVAEVVVSAGNKVGVNMPVVPVFRQYAANGLLVGSGIAFLVFSAIVVVPVAKFALIAVGIGMAVYGVYQLYKMVSGKAVHDVIPRK